MSKFKVWDVVCIKTWDEMEKEFGIGRHGINMTVPFTPQMRHLCGEHITIAGFSDHGGIRSIEGIEYDDQCPNLSGYWRITDDMVKLVGCKEYKSATDSDIDALFA